MKSFFLAAFVALAFGVVVSRPSCAANFHNGSSVAGDGTATRLQQKWGSGGGNG
jgi:hypothetical protein